jgi:hypothetical protein
MGEVALFDMWDHMIAHLGGNAELAPALRHATVLPVASPRMRAAICGPSVSSIRIGAHTGGGGIANDEYPDLRVPSPICPLWTASVVAEAAGHACVHPAPWLTATGTSSQLTMPAEEIVHGS